MLRAAAVALAILAATVVVNAAPGESLKDWGVKILAPTGIPQVGRFIVTPIDVRGSAPFGLQLDVTVSSNLRIEPTAKWSDRPSGYPCTQPRPTEVICSGAVTADPGTPNFGYAYGVFGYTPVAPGEATITATLTPPSGDTNPANNVAVYHIQISPPTSPASCTSTYGDYNVIDSRGSGEPLGTVSPPGLHFITVFRGLKSGKSVRATLNPYPAPGWTSFLGAVLHQSGAAYYNSINTGESWLIAKLKSLHTACPQTRVILTGYSQGAQVAGDVGAANWPNVLGVVLFGDPLYNGSDRAVDRGGYKNGSLGTRAKFFQRPGRVVISYCHTNDPICQKGVAPLINPYHENYDKLNEPAQAANLIAAAG